MTQFHKQSWIRSYAHSLSLGVAVLGFGAFTVSVAMAQTPEEQKKRQQQQQQRQQPQKQQAPQQQAPQKQPQQRVQQPPVQRQQAPVQRQVQPPVQRQAPPVQRQVTPQAPVQRPVTPQQRTVAPQQVQPRVQAPVQPKPLQPGAIVSPSNRPQRNPVATRPVNPNPPPQQGNPRSAPARQAVPNAAPNTVQVRPSGGTALAPPKPGPQRLDQVKGSRVVKTEGTRRIVTEPGNRVIIREGNRSVIRHDEGARIQRFAPGAQVTRRPGGVTQTVFVRPGGARVFTETDSHGRILRRYRRDGGGREIVLIDNRRFYRNVAIGVGAAALGVGIALALSRPAIAIPREKYIVDYDRASDDDIYEALTAAPVARLERTYSLDEIRYNEPLREHMRRVDLDTINFEFNSFDVTPDQYPKLERVARAIQRALDANPAEVFLIEGHTDAVGPDEDNLSLSDRRAQSVAEILTTQFNIPLENLVTQGYGEQFLKVQTQEPERINRRVAVRRITPLLSQEGPPGDGPVPDGVPLPR